MISVSGIAICGCRRSHPVNDSTTFLGGCVNRFRFAPALASFLFAGVASAQAPAKVDFGKDVLPILRQNCFGCHGSAQQMSGLRLDRKSAVISRRGVVPG